MSPVIYSPPDSHECLPPMYRVEGDGPYAPAYKPGTIWACDDCGQRWIVDAVTYFGPTIADHIAGRTVTTTWWEHHDKDTP